MDFGKIANFFDMLLIFQRFFPGHIRRTYALNFEGFQQNQCVAGMAIYQLTRWQAMTRDDISYTCEVISNGAA